MTTIYSWQKSNWRNFTFDETRLVEFERRFLHLSGIAIGIHKALSPDDKEALKISLTSAEAMNTSMIEGEFLDRASVQSSVQRFFQLKAPLNKNRPRENGIANMMVDLFLTFDTPLSHEMLFAWHRMVMNGRSDLQMIGKYRVHDEPMQIISGQIDAPRIHYEAPPSSMMPDEMRQYISWFNASRSHLSPLARAGIAHLYFELIHPFEDGNGRIGRSLIEKALAQSLGQPTLIAISQIIQEEKKAYYDALEQANKSNEITEWLLYFCDLILNAQQFTIDSIEFVIEKTRFFDQHAHHLNQRQEKLLQRIFEEGRKGFTGGVSVKKYIAITKTSPATANRDLNDLVAKGIMKRTGQLKSTRYWLLTDLS